MEKGRGKMGGILKPVPAAGLQAAAYLEVVRRCGHGGGVRIPRGDHLPELLLDEPGVVPRLEVEQSVSEGRGGERERDDGKKYSNCETFLSKKRGGER